MEIKLPSGHIVLVDDEDCELVSQFNWNVKDNGYVRATKKPHILIHRLILNAKKGELIDHIDRNPLNNQKSNIRLCNGSQNNMNTVKKQGCASKYKGVIWNKKSNKWEAKVKKDRKWYYIGLFNNEDEAGLAYNKKAKELHGEFARLNIIE